MRGYKLKQRQEDEQVEKKKKGFCLVKRIRKLKSGLEY